MTSGAIQHGVPTNVLRVLVRVRSPPVAKKALTPKSEEKHKHTKQNLNIERLNSLLNDHLKCGHRKHKLFERSHKKAREVCSAGTGQVNCVCAFWLNTCNLNRTVVPQENVSSLQVSERQSSK